MNLFSPRVILGEENAAVAIETDQEEDMAADVRHLVRDVANDFMVGQERVLERVGARIAAKGSPIRRAVAAVHTGEQLDVLFAELDGVEVLLRH